MSSNTEVVSIHPEADLPAPVVAKTPKAKKLKPARKQVKPGEVEKSEAPQTGKEYSVYIYITRCLSSTSC